MTGFGRLPIHSFSTYILFVPSLKLVQEGAGVGHVGDERDLFGEKKVTVASGRTIHAPPSELMLRRSVYENSGVWYKSLSPTKSQIK